MTKLFLSAASLTDLHRPTDKISLTQYAALTLTGKRCPSTSAAPRAAPCSSPTPLYPSKQPPQLSRLPPRQPPNAGFIFTFYGMYVTPINYPLTAVNILLCGSSGWHLGRKIKADFL